MPGAAIDALAVGQIVTYVAPGFFARAGYRAIHPSPDRPAGETVVITVALSLPIVAAVQALMPGAQRPAQLGYAAVLVASALTAGYVVGLVRGTDFGMRRLARLGYRLRPEGTIYAQTLRRMNADASVVVELKDGRRIWGTPSIGPQTKDDGVQELYLTHPRAEAGAEWKAVGAGIIVPLAEISTITLSEDPTASATI